MTLPGGGFGELLSHGGAPIVLPSAHDALSARLIEQAGFRGLSISGSSLLAARYALPDLGLAGLGEMASGVADILSATRLPTLVDGDDGYGDDMAVRRTIATYERLGAAAVTIEDQARAVKRPGQGNAVALVELHTITAKMRAAVAARADPDFWIVGRTDAYTVEGIDEAVRRAEAMRDAGADALFVAGVKDASTLEQVARRLTPTPLVAVDYGAIGWSLPSPDALAELGYRLLVHPLVLLPAITAVMSDRLSQLNDGKRAPMTPGSADAGMALLREATKLAG
ncbi:isocitrate lyase/PEP mutase family protein [Novosphingobium sp.]|uniref:isocitrate lyase/PEP mutase family protein n=1 Tax=Novosphingobium sp. TaxID=1874826 RepID=UPI002FE3782E